MPLRQVVESGEDRGPATISRTDRRRSVKITADVDGDIERQRGGGAVHPRGARSEVPSSFPGCATPSRASRRTRRDSVREIGLGFLGALVVMYVLIAIPLRSYVQPLIIMSVIPFGLVGRDLGARVHGDEPEHHVDVRAGGAGRGGGERLRW